MSPNPLMVTAWRSPLLYFGPLPKTFCKEVVPHLHRLCHDGKSIAIRRCYWEDDGEGAQLVVQFNPGYHPAKEIAEEVARIIARELDEWTISQQ